MFVIRERIYAHPVYLQAKINAFRNNIVLNFVLLTTCYGMDGPGIESRCRRDLPPPSSPALGPTHPHLVPKLKKGRAIPLPTLWNFMACSTVKCNFYGEDSVMLVGAQVLFMN